MPQSRGAFSVERLGNGWRLLANCPLGGAVVHIVLIRPGVGVAVLEIEPTWHPDALTRLRGSLEAAGFPERFPGHLPAIHRRLRAADVPSLEIILAEAFEWQDPISVEGEGSWEDAVERALTPAAAPQVAPAAPVPPPQDRPAPAAERSWRTAAAVAAAACIAGGVAAAVLMPRGSGGPSPAGSSLARAVPEPASGPRIVEASMAPKAGAGSPVSDAPADGVPEESAPPVPVSAAPPASPPAAEPAPGPARPDAQAPAAVRAETTHDTSASPEAASASAGTGMDTRPGMQTGQGAAADQPAPQLAAEPIPEPDLVQGEPFWTDPPRAIGAAPSEPIPEPDPVQGEPFWTDPLRAAAAALAEAIAEPDPLQGEPFWTMAPLVAATVPVEPFAEPDPLQVDPFRAEAPRIVVAEAVEPLAEPDAVRGAPFWQDLPGPTVAAVEALPEPDPVRAAPFWALPPAPERPSAAPSPAASVAQPAPPAVAAPAQSAVPAQRMDPAVRDAMLRRGEALLMIGDISGARRFLERAADGGSAAAAMAMAETYDPALLASRGVIGLPADRSAALDWYRRALTLGANAAAARIFAIEATR